MLYCAFFGSGICQVDEQQHSIVQLYAGTRPDGEPVYEKVAVRSTESADYCLLHSPGFVRGVARGDIIRLSSAGEGQFEVIRRSGNLAVRVYARADISVLDAALTPQISQLEGRRDINAAQLLVYSIPVSAGFDSIESIFDLVLSGSADASWAYGNVYDEASGEPLGWWLQAPTHTA